MQTVTPMPTFAWQRLPQLLERYRCGCTTLYRRVGTGLIPPPVKLGPNTSAWPQHELDAIDRARLAGADDTEIRGLVQQLVIDRRAAA
jgi:prophage regulatory protein